MKHFTIAELTASDTARTRGIINTPSDYQRGNLTRLVELLLDPLREAWGSPIIVNSGFRNAKLNHAVGGSSTSAHLTGHAADIRPLDTVRMAEFKAFVRHWLATTRTPFDQYIDERTAASEWVHLARCNAHGLQRRQFLQYRNGKYLPL